VIQELQDLLVYKDLLVIEDPKAVQQDLLEKKVYKVWAVMMVI
jgi:hypothetical protein